MKGKCDELNKGEGIPFSRTISNIRIFPLQLQNSETGARQR